MKRSDLVEAGRRERRKAEEHILLVAHARGGRLALVVKELLAGRRAAKKGQPKVVAKELRAKVGVHAAGHVVVHLKIVIGAAAAARPFVIGSARQYVENHLVRSAQLTLSEVVHVDGICKAARWYVEDFAERSQGESSDGAARTSSRRARAPSFILIKPT